MDSNFAEKTALPGTTPVWLKWILLTLLFASAIAGFSSGRFFFKKSAILHPVSLGQKLGSGTTNCGGISKISGKINSCLRNFSDGTIICQGTIIREKGKALAMINGRTASVGSTVNGVRIREINAGNILVEYNGQTRRLNPGERFEPKKQ